MFWQKKENSESFETEKEEKRAWQKFATYLIPLILIPLFAYGIKSLTFELFRVDGTSMERFLTQEDRLFVEKFGQQYARVKGDPYTPKRYEVVVFNLEPEYAENASADQFVKRVIGLPGERVVVKNGITTVFNNESPEGLAVDEILSVQLERDISTDIDVDTVVPDGHVFVMGDNRQESYDSREMGPINNINIVGRATILIYPLDRLFIL